MARMYWRIRKQMEHRAALQIQRVFRGIQGRHEAAAKRRTYERRVMTAINIQKRFRARKIGCWRDVKIRRLIGEFLRNKDRHIAAAKERTKRNFFRIRAVLRKDPCEDMPDGAGIAYDWYQYWDEGTQRWLWYSRTFSRGVVDVECTALEMLVVGWLWSTTATLDKREKMIPNYDFELSLVGLRVQIFWPLQNTWFPGKITRFNAVYKKWKIEYDVRQ
jgi:hypothetical protein